MAIAFCGADLMPFRCVSTPTQGVMTLASSAPVTTAMTPGAFFAFALVDLPDTGMRERRAQIGDMRHARQRHVADDIARGLAISRFRFGRGTERPI